jgi:hypothetical protein
MKKVITKKNAEVLAKIKSLAAKLKRSPTLKEIGSASKLSQGGVLHHIGQLGLKRNKKGELIIK